MTEFFKNNPTALRHCLLYEYLQNHTFEHAHLNIRCVIGKEVINYKIFKFWFDKFSEGNFNDEEKATPIDILRNDKYALRVCILYKSLTYLKTVRPYSVFTNFERFCKVIGDGVIEYREFDFWFYRFLSGKFDLNSEMDKDAKIHELMDMPIDVMKIIVEYLNILDRTNIAKTSRSLQTFVEDQKLFHRRLELKICYKMVFVLFCNSTNPAYIRKGNDCVKRCNNRDTLIPNVFHWKQAVLDLEKFLKNPKLHLENLEIDSNVTYKNACDSLENAFKFTHYLNVKNLNLKEYSTAYLPNIIPFLKPGYLETIRIYTKEPKVDSMKKVMETEQWKQAKSFTLNGACFIWPLRILYHFEIFHITLKRLTLEDIREIKQVLFKSPDFKKCWLIFHDNNDISIFGQEFGNALRENPYIYHYPLDNSTDYFEIEVKEWSIVITRKKN